MRIDGKTAIQELSGFRRFRYVAGVVPTTRLNAVQAAFARKSAGERNFPHGQSGALQVELRGVDTGRQDIFVRGVACLFLEQPGKIIRKQAFD
jgi:hypothetical protein